MTSARVLKKVSLCQKPGATHWKTKQREMDLVCNSALCLGLRCPVLSPSQNICGCPAGRSRRERDDTYHSLPELLSAFIPP